VYSHSGGWPTQSRHTKIRAASFCYHACIHIHRLYLFSRDDTPSSTQAIIEFPPILCRMSEAINCSKQALDNKLCLSPSNSFRTVVVVVYSTLYAVHITRILIINANVSEFLHRLAYLGPDRWQRIPLRDPAWHILPRLSPVMERQSCCPVASRVPLRRTF
jgi:hypothetical protein